jgi:thiol-disulfide isomerase/thioredoxin
VNLFHPPVPRPRCVGSHRADEKGPLFRPLQRASRVPGAAARSARRAAVGALAAAAVILGVAACDGGATAQDTAVGNGSSFVAGSYSTTVFKLGAGPEAPDVSGTTLTGARFKLSADRGSVVIMNFWGSWCTPCREEAPALGALARHFAGTGVRFIGVDIRDDPASAEAFMRTFRVGYPSLNDPNDMVALDFSGTVPPSGIPTTLVIDRNGRVAARIVGPASYSGLMALITQAAAER